MTYNNTVILIGNTGKEAELIEDTGKPFVVVSLATTDQYQDEQQNWVDNETIWHDVLAFSPKAQAELRALKAGTRIKLTGTLSYRTIQVFDEAGNPINRKTASIIAKKVELATLYSKGEKPEDTASTPEEQSEKAA